MPHPCYPSKNVPLAAGYPKAWAYCCGLLDRVDIGILSPRLASYGGDAAIVDAIVAAKPDVLGFSLYMWNADRTAHIIHGVRARLTAARVVVGGPEVSRDGDYLRSCDGIDVAVNRRVQLYLDARMGAEVLRLYTIRPTDADAVALYEANLYTSGDAERLPCSARAIVYGPLVAGTLIALQVKRFAVDQPLKKEVLFDLTTLNLIVT